MKKPKPIQRSIRRRPHRTHRPSLEALESRQLLAGFGQAWPDPRSLTVSFPTDNAMIGAFDNQLRSTLDQVADRRVWQESVLRAFQTWAVQTNLNIGLSEDRGDHFGEIGLTQNDPRFGDFRIGAFPQTGVLANALPFERNSGTWAGDIFLNSRTNFFLADWQTSPLSVPSTNEQGPAVELFSVLLHEAGNALGLPDVNRPAAVMHQSYTGPKGQLTTADRDAIRRLYGGARQDIHEPVANNTRTTATVVSIPPATAENAAIVQKGSLNRVGDIDFYRFSPVPGKDKVTIRFQASGISLLKGSLSVLDSRGQVLADAKVDSIFDNDLTLEIGSLQTHRQLFIRVAANASDVFAIGDYQVTIDHRPPELQPSDTRLIVDADAEDDDDVRGYRPEENVDVIFANAGFIDNERGTNDTLGTATPLNTAIGFLAGTRYESIATITHGDVDVLRFRTAPTSGAALSIKVETLGQTKPTLHADVLDSSGQRVAAVVTASRDGSVRFTVQNPLPHTDYFLRIRAAAGEITTGNYAVIIDQPTTAPATSGEQIAAANVNAGQSLWSRFAVYKTQLFRLDLEALAISRDAGIQLTLFNPKTATVVFSMAAAAMSSRRDYVWLQQGEYVLLASAIARQADNAFPVQFRLLAAGISDDQGPLPVDPTDPYGGTYPVVNDPYGGEDPWVSPVPDPYGGSSPFPEVPAPSVGPFPYEPPPLEDPWYYDPYYDPYAYG